MSLLLQGGGEEKTLLKTRRPEPSAEIGRKPSCKSMETCRENKDERKP